MKKKKIIIPIITITAIIILLILFLDPSARYNKKFVTQDKWNNIISTRTENKKLTFDIIDFNDYNLIINEKGNMIYYSLVNDSDNKYNPIVSFKSQDSSAKIAILEDEITDEKVKSDYKFKIMIYNNSEYHIYNLVCTDFPILNISYKLDAESKQKNIPMKMYLFNNLSSNTNRVTISDGKFKIKEDGYSFSLNMMTPGKNIRENRISILNMKPSNEYILTKTLEEENQAPDETTNVKNNRVALFINSEYQGIYTLSHKVERENTI